MKSSDDHVLSKEERDKMLLKFKSKKQNVQGILCGDYHPNAYSKDFQQELEDENVKKGNVGLFPQSAQSKDQNDNEIELTERTVKPRRQNR